MYYWKPIQKADGGKVSLLNPLGEACVGCDDKAIATDRVIVANFQQNRGLIDWINKQPLSLPLTCIGDGRDGVWNLMAAIKIQSSAIFLWLLLKSATWKFISSN